MADNFSLTGSYLATPAQGQPSGIASIPSPIDEELLLSRKHYDTVVLDTDSPVDLAFGGISQAHVVILKASAKVRARMTSADGSAQAAPTDMLILICRDTPITAIDLTRVAGAGTTVDVFLGQI